MGAARVAARPGARARAGGRTALGATDELAEHIARPTRCCCCSTTSSTSSAPRPTLGRAPRAPAPNLDVLVTSRERLRVPASTSIAVAAARAPTTRSRCSCTRASGRSATSRPTTRVAELCAGSTTCRSRSSSPPRALKVLTPEQLLDRLESASTPQRRPATRPSAADAARDDRVELRPARRRTSSSCSPGSRLRRRLDARGRRGGLRRRPRHARVARRQEPRPPPASGALLDARDDPRVLRGTASAASGTGCPRGCSSIWSTSASKGISPRKRTVCSGRSSCRRRTATSRPRSPGRSARARSSAV